MVLSRPYCPPPLLPRSSCEAALEVIFSTSVINVNISLTYIAIIITISVALTIIKIIRFVHASSQPKPSALHVDLSAILKDTALLYPFLQVWRLMLTLVLMLKMMSPQNHVDVWWLLWMSIFLALSVSEEERRGEFAAILSRCRGFQQEDDGEFNCVGHHNLQNIIPLGIIT